MIATDTIAALENRLEKALADCATWRATGQEERYLETYCLIEALETELHQRMRGVRE